MWSEPPRELSNLQRVVGGDLQVNTSLQTLHLVYNSLGPEAGKALAEALKARAGPCLVAAFGKDFKA